MAHLSKTELTYEPELTGLLIVDPYNDFLSEGGKLYELSRSTLEANNVVEHMRQVLAAARANDVQVFIAPHHRWREGDPYSHWKTMPPVQASAAKGHVFADGTWGGSFHPDFQPHPGEVVAQEHWLSSGFANTDLDLQLKKHGLRTVIVIGMRANTCIESTVRFAAELGYEVTLVKDAIGSFGHAEMDASLQFNIPAYASAVVSTDEIVAQLSVGHPEAATAHQARSN
ncbi:MAG TPA: isochorismatase family cysteine hydrolase [Mycobacterium sp.]|jgi:nicotinamidase-related amidase